MRHRNLLVLLVAGALVAPATGASAQLITTTTITLPLPTTTTTTTTTTTAPESTTTTETPTTTAAPTTSTTDLVGGVTSLLTTTTTTTVAPLAGSLTISAPDEVSLAAAAASATSSASMGAVTVDDARAGSLGWSAVVSATDFTLDVDPGVALPAANVAYWSGPATATTGTATFVPGQLIDALAQALDDDVSAFAALGALGATSATWNPTIIVSVPATAIAGTYTGTITHSAA